MIKTYDEALSFIHGRTQFKKIPTLTRMKRFLAELGNPQEGLKYIHVTGTNGKGSTVAMMRSALLKVALLLEVLHHLLLHDLMNELSIMESQLVMMIF